MVVPSNYDSPENGRRKRGFHTPMRSPAPLDVFETFVASETFSEAVERFDEVNATLGIKDASSKSIELLFIVSCHSIQVISFSITGLKLSRPTELCRKRVKSLIICFPSVILNSIIQK